MESGCGFHRRAKARTFLFVLAGSLAAAIGHTASLDDGIAVLGHRLLVGDYNGDQRSDLLWQGQLGDEHRSALTGIELATEQRWRDGFLELPWNQQDVRLVIGDFNGDASSDVLLQAATANALTELVSTHVNGQLGTPNQTIGDYHLGLRWDQQHRNLIVGDFDGDGRDDLFLQGLVNRDRHGVALSTSEGTFESLASDFDNAHLGADWQGKKANLIAGDFNGDGRSELLLQPHAEGALVRVDSQNGILDQIAETIEQNQLGIDWRASAHRLIAGDFTGDGRDDLFLLATDSELSSALVTTRENRFSHIEREITTIPDLDKVRQILVGDFDADGIDDLVLTYHDTALSPLALLAGAARRTALEEALSHLGLLRAGQELRSESGRAPAGEHRDNETPTTASGVLIGPSLQTHSIVSQTATDSMTTKTVDSVSLNAAAVANAVGRLQGEATVSGGAASYLIPIAVPPGRNGVQPSVSLSYSSRAGNGVAGMGWSLNAGQSSIHRCPNNVVLDGFTRGVAMDEQDKLCLDGQRLKNENGAYGQNGTVYRTELESFVRVVQTGALSSSSSTFLVKHKDGSRGYYEQAVVPSAISAPLTWLLTRQIDIHGNTIRYAYSPFGDGEWLLTKIEYTGFSAPPSYSTSETGTRSVHFEYAPRGDRSSAWLANGLTSQTQILKYVRTFAPTPSGGAAQLVREYSLSHITSEASQRTLLAWVQECAYDNGVAACLKETQFSWDHSKPRFVLEKLGHRTAVNGALTPVLQDKRKIDEVLPRGDTNGDGVLDWPATDANGDGVIEASGFYVDAEGRYRGSSSAIVNNCIPNYHSRTQQCISADFDNNGLTDHWKKDGTLRVAYQQDDGSSPQWRDTGIPLNKPSDSSRQPDQLQAVSDLNGDGWNDLVVYHDTGTGAQLKAYYHSKNREVPYQVSYSQVMYAWTFAQVSNGATKVATVQASLADDFDGNGLPDIVVTQVMRVVQGVPVGIPGGLPTTVVFTKAAADNTVTYIPTSLKNLVPSGEEPYLGINVLGPQNQSDAFYFNFFHDVNGDGLVDWLGLSTELQVRINTGGRFRSWQVLGEAPTGLLFHQTQEYLWNQQDGELGYIRWPAYDTYIRVMDVNNDGRLELLVPNRRRVSACYKVLGSWSGGFGYQYVCDNDLYGTYKPSSNAAQTAITLSDKDAGVFDYDAVYFEQDSSGQQRSRIEASGLVGTAGHTAVADVFGKGLADFVTTIGCRSVELCRVEATDIQAAGITGLDGEGVYVNRNTGSAGANEPYRPVDTLRSVTDGFGQQAEWIQRPLSTGDYPGASCSGAMPSLYETDHNYISGAPIGQYFHFASSMYVVAEFKQSNGVGSMNSVRHRYRGAVYNRWGRGFQGFRELISEDDKGLLSCNTFAQLFPLTGLVQARKIRAIGANRTLTDTSNSLEAMQPFGDGLTYLPYIKTSNTTATDLSGTLLGTTSVTVQLDSWGNPDETTTTISDAYITHVTTSDPVFAKDNTEWPDKSLTETTSQRLSSIAAPVPTGIVGEERVIARRIVDWFDESRRLPRIVVSGHPSDGSQQLTTAYHYDSYGNVLSSTISGGSGNTEIVPRSRSTIYDSQGYFADYQLNAHSHRTELTIDPRHGQLIYSQDPLSNELNIGFDAFGRVTRKQINSRTAEVSTYSSDIGSDGVANAKYKTTVQQTGIKPKMVTWFDALNRPLRTETDYPFDSSRKIRTEVTYDRYGRTLRQSTPYFSDTSFSSCQQTEFADYDVLDRPAQKKLPNDNGCQLTITYNYAGPQTNVQVGPDSAYQISRIKNALGQWWQVTDQGSESSYGNSASLTTHFRYDAQGNPVLVQRMPEDGAAIRNTASYNVLGHKTSMSDPDRGSWSFEYNVLGELRHQVDARNQHSWFDYDVLGRLHNRYEAIGVAATRPSTATASWSFDGDCFNGNLSNGRLLCSSSKGNEVSKTYRYTSKGLLTQTVYNLNAPGETAQTFTINQSYDGVEERPETLVYPATTGGTALTLKTLYRSDSGVAYQQRSVNALGGLNAEATLYQLNSIDAFGNSRDEWLGNGLNSTRAYSERTGRLTGLCVNPTANCSVNSSGNLQAIDYGAGGILSDHFDVYGNLTKQINRLQKVTENFQYDRRQRLVSSSRVADVGAGFPTLSNQVDYRYDALGNLLRKTDFAANYHYDLSTGNDPHQVKEVRDISGNVLGTYVWDDNGNLTSSTGPNARTLTYNHQHVPTHISRGSAASMFFYDENNERYFERHVDSGKTTKIWKLGKLYEYSETNESGATSKEEKSYFGNLGQYSYKPAQNGRAACGNWRFFHADRLGSIETVTNLAKQVIERHGFDPFGKPLKGNWMADSTRDGTLNAQKGLYNRVTARGYTGHDHIDSVGLIHANGRMYDPELGRFTGVDPFMQAPLNSQSLNPYSYVMNNPLAGTDPTGYLSTCDVLGGSACKHQQQTINGASGHTSMAGMLSSMGLHGATSHLTSKLAAAHALWVSNGNKNKQTSVTVREVSTEQLEARPTGAVESAATGNQNLSPDDGQLFADTNEYRPAFKKTTAHSLEDLPFVPTRIKELKEQLASVNQDLEKVDQDIATLAEEKLAKMREFEARTEASGLVGSSMPLGASSGTDVAVSVGADGIGKALVVAQMRNKLLSEFDGRLDELSARRRELVNQRDNLHGEIEYRTKAILVRWNYERSLQDGMRYRSEMNLRGS